MAESIASAHVSKEPVTFLLACSSTRNYLKYCTKIPSSCNLSVRNDNLLATAELRPAIKHIVNNLCSHWNRPCSYCAFGKAIGADSANFDRNFCDTFLQREQRVADPWMIDTFVTAMALWQVDSQVGR